MKVVIVSRTMRWASWLMESELPQCRCIDLPEHLSLWSKHLWGDPLPQRSTVSYSQVPQSCICRSFSVSPTYINDIMLTYACYNRKNIMHLLNYPAAITISTTAASGLVKPGIIIFHFSLETWKKKGQGCMEYWRPEDTNKTSAPPSPPTLLDLVAQKIQQRRFFSHQTNQLDSSELNQKGWRY